MTITRYTRRSPVFSPWLELEDMSDPPQPALQRARHR